MLFGFTEFGGESFAGGGGSFRVEDDGDGVRPRVIEDRFQIGMEQGLEVLYPGGKERILHLLGNFAAPVCRKSQVIAPFLQPAGESSCDLIGKDHLPGRKQDQFRERFQ